MIKDKRIKIKDKRIQFLESMSKSEFNFQHHGFGISEFILLSCGVNLPNLQYQ
jgi:hypothetical protein